MSKRTHTVRGVESSPVDRVARQVTQSGPEWCTPKGIPQKSADVGSAPALRRTANPLGIPDVPTGVDLSTAQLWKQVRGDLLPLYRPGDDERWIAPYEVGAVLQEVSLVFQKFPHVSAGWLLREHIQLLMKARSLEPTDEERARIDALLYHAYLPLAERRATSPERYAKDLTDVYREVYFVTVAHLLGRTEGP